MSIFLVGFIVAAHDMSIHWYFRRGICEVELLNRRAVNFGSFC